MSAQAVIPCWRCQGYGESLQDKNGAFAMVACETCGGHRVVAVNYDPTQIRKFEKAGVEKS